MNDFELEILKTLISGQLEKYACYSKVSIFSYNYNKDNNLYYVTAYSEETGEMEYIVSIIDNYLYLYSIDFNFINGKRLS